MKENKKNYIIFSKIVRKKKDNKEIEKRRGKMKENKK